LTSSPEASSPPFALLLSLPIGSEFFEFGP
jgi:hypothetical protein